jgi:hypothetical protein
MGKPLEKYPWGRLNQGVEDNINIDTEACHIVGLYVNSVELSVFNIIALFK